ncbi:MAG: PUA domain-containing protein [Candidatus Kariarchaeaceae archaeon]|jgi:PUA domain protein
MVVISKYFKVNVSKYTVIAVSGKDRRVLVNVISKYVENPEVILPKKGLYRYFLNKKEALIVNKQKEVLLLEFDNRVIPSLRSVRNTELLLPKIVVDLGAIKFVTNGADIMRPGVTHIPDNIVEGDIVLIVEERKGGALAIGIALYDAVDMQQMKNGKCIKNLHYLGDDWWNFIPK